MIACVSAFLLVYVLVYPLVFILLLFLNINSILVLFSPAGAGVAASVAAVDATVATVVSDADGIDYITLQVLLV